MPSPEGNIRIGNVSGATGDAPHALARMVQDGDVDVVVGDWLSEMNIAWNAIIKADNPDLGYEVGFYTQLEECIDEIVAKKIKVVTNAGALNARSLSKRIEELCASRSLKPVIATVVGDDVSHLVTRAGRSAPQADGKHTFKHLDHPEQSLDDWDLEPTCAAAYIGCWGIAEALDEGADIVVCGRCTDASLVMGAAASYYGWSKTSYSSLAGSLVAGHLIECGPYACGANYSGFKPHLKQLVDVGFPIAEILPNGESFISKGFANGFVNQFNIRAQFLYELQGHIYLNPDVAGDFSNISIEDAGKEDLVRVSGVTGHAPPSTTKVMIAAPGGFQAETTYYINGLDVAAKAQMMKNQLENIFGGAKFSKFSAELYGKEVENPSSQAEGTCMLRVFAQARQKEDISAEKFKIPIYSLRMQSYPGYHMNLDFRTMDPKPFMEIFPSTISLSAIEHQVLIPSTGKVIDIPPAMKTATYPVQRPSYETAHPVDLASFGETVRAPLGSIVHARSGDKANNSNVGFFVRNEDEYPWLQSFMTVERVKTLLGNDYGGHRIERVEFPRILAVHFRIMDFLDGGIASSSRIDGLGKGVGEYLRSRHVDVPEMFIGRGWI